MMNIHDKANRTMNPLCLSSLLFGCIGTLLYTSTYRTEGCGMIVVSITSLLYHKTYYSVFRIMDGLSNGALMMFFLLNPNVCCHYRIIRLWWILVTVFGFLHTLPYCTKTEPLPHLLAVHLPVLLGFLCVCTEY